MDQNKALNALYPFLTLARTATTPRQAADIVTQATSSPHTYLFAELLCTPAIQSLRTSPEHSPSYRLLEIFTWGTCADYTSTSPPLPPLNDQQALKLRLLSLLTLISSPVPDLRYRSLTTALSLASTEALESLITTAIYAELLVAALDPARQMVMVRSVAPLRDLAPGSVGELIRGLEGWMGRCEGVLAEMEAKVVGLKAEAGKRDEWETAVAAQKERAEMTWRIEGADRDQRFMGGLGGGAGDRMDVDGGLGAGRRRQAGRKK